jgi:hypothetical protein
MKRSDPTQQTTPSSPAREGTPASLAMTKGPAQPQQVWSLLAPEQQQATFRAVVRLCRSLVAVPPDRADRPEVTDERR